VIVPQDITLKVERAEAHLARQNFEVTEFLRIQNESIFCEPEDGGLRYVYRVGNPFPIPSHWAALIGDLLFNLRSALDHLAYALTPEPNERTEFPIFVNEEGPKGFIKRAPSKMPGVSPDVWNAVKDVQPYTRGDKRWLHPLSEIHELNRIDKHRLLLVAVVAVEQGTWGSPPGVPTPALTILEAHDLTEDNRIAVFTFPTPQAQVELNAKFALDVFLEAAVRVQAIRKQLDYFCYFIRERVIAERFAKFFT